MADIKLFHLNKGNAKPKNPLDFKLEREIQRICESNLEVLFGIRFLASEYGTGAKHMGRIDTLGIDENNCPVIIEYKLDSKENVINQGLFYLDWLMDHKADFELLCMRILDQSGEIDWSNPRLLCIAKDFTRYDDYAIAQINRNIELIRYRAFEGDNIIFEQAGTTQRLNTTATVIGKQRREWKMDDAMSAASEHVLELYQELEDYIFSLGDDVQKKELKYYHAYSRIKNFVCTEIRSQKNEILLYLKIDYNKIDNPPVFLRDVSNIGHFGTGDLEAVIKTVDELEEVKKYILASYNNS